MYIHVCIYMIPYVFLRKICIYLYTPTVPMSPRSICKLFFQCILEVCAALVLTKPFPIAHPTPCFDGVQPTEL